MKMSKVRANDLSGQALDWAHGKASDIEIHVWKGKVMVFGGEPEPDYTLYQPSADYGVSACRQVVQEKLGAVVEVPIELCSN